MKVIETVIEHIEKALERAGIEIPPRHRATEGTRSLWRRRSPKWVITCLGGDMKIRFLTLSPAVLLKQDW